MKSILDKGFKYVPSFETNVKKTFEKIRKLQALKPEAPIHTGKVVVLHKK